MKEESSIITVEKEVKARHPVRSLLLIDVLQDRASRPVLIWAFGTIFFGTIVYYWLEGWSVLDSIYFCVITLATVGYGDLSPTTPLAKAFTIVYVINGVTILLAFFDRIRDVRMRNIDVRRFDAEDQSTS